MKLILVVCLALALAPASQAGVTMTVRDVPVGNAHVRTLAGAQPRFNLVALHWQGSGIPWFRTRSVGGRWSAWQAADDDWGRSGVWRKQGSPSWVGASDAIQYRLQGQVTRLRAYFLWSGAEPSPSPPRRLAMTGTPAIVSRAAWGADEEIRRAPPVYAPALRFAVIHHTVNSNDYTERQSAAIVRAIEVYHVKGNGWNDIGYNFIVDKYGQIFEGRYGGIDKPVVGAHSLGFNTGSVGIAVLGTYSKTPISAAAKTALEQLLAWRLDVAHIDPLSTVTVTSGGNSKWPAGKKVKLRAISGHRDTYFTDCPGNALYAELPQIAQDVAALGLPKLYSPVRSGRLGGPIRFTAQLSTSLPWTVTVTDPAGTVVASGSGAGTAVDWTWDASSTLSGSYRWAISAGPTVRPATGTIGGKAVAIAVTDAQATPAVVTTTSTIGYTLSASATVTATLLDASGAVAATLFSAPQPAGAQAFGFTVPPSVPDGSYTIQLIANAVGGGQATASVPIEIDRTVTTFSVTPQAFSPNGDGIQDTLAVTFELASAQGVSLVVQQDGGTVATLKQGPVPADASILVPWDGIEDDGTPAPDGTYTLVLTAGAVTRTLPIVVDTRAPALKAISWKTFRFATDEAATVTLKAGSRRFTKRLQKPGRLYFWMKTRPSHYVVRARDAAGNVTILKH